MGMSATQARLLQLTSMLNDVEFEGQQINMARTQLSSTSAKFYNQLLSMEVPTPPVKTDYTNIVYTYTANNQEYTISSIGPMDENNVATINVQSTQNGITIGKQTDTMEITSEEEIIPDSEVTEPYFTENPEDLYSISTSVKAATGYTSDANYVDSQGNSVNDQVRERVNAQVASNQYINSNGNIVSEYTDGLQKKGEEEFETYYEEETYTDENGEEQTRQVEKERSYDPPKYKSAGEVTAEDFAGCVQDYYEEVDENEAEAYIGQKAATQTNYYCDGRELISLGDEQFENSENSVIQNLKTAITNAGEDPDDYYVVSDGNNGYKCFKKDDVEDGDGVANTYTSTSGQILVDEEIEGAHLEFDSNGRLAAVTLPNDTKRYAVESNTEVDELAYEEAYANYTYEKSMYDKDQAAINAQLSTIQSQDKRLELQLTELDTRRTQITTELDALQTVLGDNIERTYKTFSG